MLHISSKLLFISNELLDKGIMEKLGVPAHVISPAFIEGKMYVHYGNEGTFVVEYGARWGNDVVYGAIYAIQDFDFYIRLLDSYHQCSMGLLGYNHRMDIHHRLQVDSTPISFNTLDDFSRLKYAEREQISVNAYHGNLKHPRIKQRLNQTISYRIVDGVDRNFKKLFGGNEDGY